MLCLSFMFCLATSFHMIFHENLDNHYVIYKGYKKIDTKVLIPGWFICLFSSKFWAFNWMWYTFYYCGIWTKVCTMYFSHLQFICFIPVTLPLWECMQLIMIIILKMEWWIHFIFQYSLISSHNISWHSFQGLHIIF